MAMEIRCYIVTNHSPGFRLPAIELTSNQDTDDLREAIKTKASPALDKILVSRLLLFKVKRPIPLDDNDLGTAVAHLFSDGKAKEDELETLDCVRLSAVFPNLPLGFELHIVVCLQEAATSKFEVLIRTLKRKRDGPIDISPKLLGLWTTPVELDIQHLRKYFETPLEQDWKIPLSHSQWQKLLFKRDGFPLENCFDEDLQSLFRPSEDEMADRIWYMFRDAIMNGPLDPTGTEESLHQFWDTNIRTILVRCLSADSIRNSRNQGTTEDAQEAFLPRLGILLRCVCVFRGEDKRQSFTGMHPQLELKQKTRWVYDPAPYILGFVTIAAIHRQEDQTLGVWDIAKADLSPRRERIRSLSRMIKLCGILRSLHQVIGDGKDADMSFETCEGDKRIEFGRSYVHKVYGLGGHDEDHTKERITHLQAVYTFLALKHVPNVDRLRKAEILHPRRGSYVDLEPRGINPNSMSLLDVRNAVVCVLEALQVMHADPAIFHRDIRWPNIMQSREDASKWFLTGKILPLSRPKQQNV